MTAPTCKVIATTLATEASSDEAEPGLLERILRKLLPAANPDLENLYPLVRLWWVEIDERGRPQREVGFDDMGKSVVAGPVGRNMGFWTDSSMIFNEAECQAVAPELFEEAWSSIEAALLQTTPGATR